MIFNNINNILHLDQSQFFYTQMVVEMPISSTAHPSAAASKLPHIAACHILRGCSAEKKPKNHNACSSPTIFAC